VTYELAEGWRIVIMVTIVTINSDRMDRVRGLKSAPLYYFHIYHHHVGQNKVMSGQQDIITSCIMKSSCPLITVNSVIYSENDISFPKV
jgi:hypothetical protein